MLETRYSKGVVQNSIHTFLEETQALDFEEGVNVNSVIDVGHWGRNKDKEVSKANELFKKITDEQLTIFFHETDSESLKSLKTRLENLTKYNEGKWSCIQAWNNGSTKGQLSEAFKKEKLLAPFRAASRCIASTKSHGYSAHESIQKTRHFLSRVNQKIQYLDDPLSQCFEAYYPSTSS